MSTAGMPTQTVGHRRHRLDAADAEDRLGAGLAQGIERMRENAVGVARRRAADDAFDPGDARDRDRHDGGADQRVLAAGNVAADAADRDQLLAEDDAGRELDLERLQTVALAPGEALDLRLAVGEVLLERLGQAAGDRADPLLGHPEVALPAIELPGERPDCLVAAIPDLGEHRAHAFLDGAMAVRLRPPRPV